MDTHIKMYLQGFKRFPNFCVLLLATTENFMNAFTIHDIFSYCPTGIRLSIHFRVCNMNEMFMVLF